MILFGNSLKYYLSCILLTISVLLLLCQPVAGQSLYFDRITSQQGLSHNTVFSIAQDDKGFMWFGTRDGLNRYDSERIKKYYFNSRHPNVESNRINCLYADGHKLWVGTAMGLFQYDETTDSFQKQELPSLRNEAQESNGNPLFVSDIKRVSSGELWVSTRQGIFVLSAGGNSARRVIPNQAVQAVCEFRKGAFIVMQDGNLKLINPEGETLIPLKLAELEPEKGLTFRDYVLFKDRRGGIWLGTNGSLFRLNESTMNFQAVDWFSRLAGPRVRVIRTISEDLAGNLWLGSESGVVVYSPVSQTAYRYDQSAAGSSHDLSDRSVYSSCVGHDGTVWLGTYFGGVNYARPANVSFHHLFPASNGQGLSGKAVSQLNEGQDGWLWVGTEDGGLTGLNQTTGQWAYHNTKNGLSDNNIHALLPDKDGGLWVGTFLGGLNYIAPTNQGKRIFRHNPADSTSLSNNSVYALCRDKKGLLWVGTQRGLNVLDERRGVFRRFRPELLGQTFIYDIAEDTLGTIWLATRSAGIYRYNPQTDKLQHFDAQNAPVLHSNQLIDIYEDRRHDLWFSSLDGGVCRWSHAQQRFVPSPVDSHLAHQTVYGVLEDNGGTYWFSTNQGLVSFNPRQGNVRTFGLESGLPVSQFNFKSAFKDSRGTLYFGTIAGLTSFSPSIIANLRFAPPLYFTALKLFNKEVKAGRGSTLTKSLDGIEELELAYDQNVITLDFVAINYFAQGNTLYTSYLEGFEPTWNPKTTAHSITYTNLSPGHYTFHVRTFRPDGLPSPTERSLHIVVNPPFWRSGLAYGFYVLLLAGALWLYRRFNRFLNEQRMAVQAERMEREKSDELNQQKLNFFTFLSNEFKTPLTLIMAEVDELSIPDRKTEPHLTYRVIRKNANRLKSLIDQLTELRKTQSGPQKPDLTELDVVTFVKETIGAFDPLLVRRDIGKRLTFSHPYLLAWFDAGRVETILGNLLVYLTNDFANGDTFHLDVAMPGDTGQEQRQLVLDIALPNRPDLIEQLRTSYRVATNNEEIFNQPDSTSLGVLLTFSLIKFLNGSVVFTNQAGTPALSISLPIRKSPANRQLAGPKKPDSLPYRLVGLMDESGLETVDAALLNATAERPETEASVYLPTLLIADRSKELVQFLKRHFGNLYRITTAHSFAEALQKAKTSYPDLILCEDGLHNQQGQTLCRVLKQTEATEAIPVVLLMDNADDGTIIEGLNGGADSYIGKPFNLNELDLLVANHLRTLTRLKNKLSKGQIKSATGGTVTNKEQVFLLRFQSLIQEQYSDSNLSVDTLAVQMQCSRSLLQSRIKLATGLSVKEFLNDLRLTIAHQCLEQGLSVADTATQVGFSDPNYFGRAFRKKYGCTPSAVNHKPTGEQIVTM